MVIKKDSLGNSLTCLVLIFFNSLEFLELHDAGFIEFGCNSYHTVNPCVT